MSEKEQKIIEMAKDLINRAYEISKEEVIDIYQVNKIDAELTSLASSIALTYREHEAIANMFKQMADSMKEVTRSMRKIHESVNTERRMTS